MPLLLVFGAAGQVGRELVAGPPPAGWTVRGLDRAAADIAEPDAVGRAVEAARPDAVANVAAYTAVDRAESEPDRAAAANEHGARHVAGAAARAGVPLIHVSTDYVFDGTKAGPYVESDPVAPLGAYGRSKEAGERAVRAACPRHVILRTAWVFAAHGSNFVRTMLRLGSERSELRVVADQRGGPTAAADIAATILVLAEALARDRAAPHGTYHYAGRPATTWHGFAEAIFAEAERWGRRPPLVRAIATAEYPTAARRPANSMLDGARLRAAFGIEPPEWRPALAAVVERLIARGTVT